MLVLHQNLNNKLSHVHSPTMSNHSSGRCVSVMMMPTMWVTGSVSMTAKVKWGSSNTMGSEEGDGWRTHSMSSRAVDELGGLPWSVALTWISQEKCWQDNWRFIWNSWDAYHKICDLRWNITQPPSGLCAHLFVVQSQVKSTWPEEVFCVWQWELAGCAPHALTLEENALRANGVGQILEVSGLAKGGGEARQ